jgi:hypothetical protein
MLLDGITELTELGMTEGNAGGVFDRIEMINKIGEGNRRKRDPESFL